MKKLKQIAALVGAVLLLGMYVLAFIFSLSHSPNAGNMLLAAIYCSYTATQGRKTVFPG